MKGNYCFRSFSFKALLECVFVTLPCILGLQVLQRLSPFKALSGMSQDFSSLLIIAVPTMFSL